MSSSAALVDDAARAAAPVFAYDAIVIGAGVAGLTFALRLPADRRVALVTKGVLGESNTRYAQGGLAVAVLPDDSTAQHAADTLVAGAGLCDPEAVRVMVDGGPAALDWLISIGAAFDRDADGHLVLGKEGAHSHHRVVHAGGDATGAEIERALVAAALARPNIVAVAGAYALDLLVENGACSGALVHLADGTLARFTAPLTAIAAGGAGQVWARTSNPTGATADGIAMAIRAGVAIADVEFAQFHPTILHDPTPGRDALLISEAVRGEGAYLRAANGDRFMTSIHPLAELAPRDIVARGIVRQMQADCCQCVFLDLRHLDAAAMRARFPTIAAELHRRGLDLATDLVPVAPAAHYFMGGIVAGADGRTSLPGLLALGEASCTGVHGANRLASNSLLEGLVFGAIAADAAAAMPRGSADTDERPTSGGWPDADAVLTRRAQAIRDELRAIMFTHAGVLRDATGLDLAADAAHHALIEAGDLPSCRPVWEVRNIATAAGAIVAAAKHRNESRGAHFRLDHPNADPALDGQHSILDRRNGEAWRFGPLSDVLEPSAV
jgi:L-aspartate oxidase